MARDIKPVIFLSHAAQDAELAVLIEKLLLKSLGLKKGSVFNSSNDVSIDVGKVAYNEITEKHKSSKVVIALMTPNSIWRSWVVFEAGGAHFSKDRELFMISANGIDFRSLPSPLQPPQIRDISKGKVLSNLCSRIAKVLSLPKPKVDRKLTSKIQKMAKVHVDGWQLVKQLHHGSKIADSPYSLRNVLERAKENIFFVGQCLHHIAQDKNTALIFRKISEGLSIDFMINDINYKCGVETWKRVTGEGFEKDLIDSIKTFRKWISKKNKRLRVKKTELCPLTMTFVDPETEHGEIVLIPIANQGIGEIRPYYVISKKEDSESFNHYYYLYKQIFEHAKPI